jgi:hypothetical protein
VSGTLQRGVGGHVHGSIMKRGDEYCDEMELDFSGEVWEWRGPSPYYFVTVPEEESSHLEAMSSLVSYGWGMIPVEATIGVTRWTTSLFPKDGRYVVPLKDAVRRAEGIGVGDFVSVLLRIAL